MSEELKTVRCPILNDGPDNHSKDVVIEFEDGQAEFIVCPKFNEKNKVCTINNARCIYSDRHKQLR